MPKHDIILINCPITFEYHLNVMGDQRYWPPLGLMYLAAVLEREGLDVEILDPALIRLSLADIIAIMEETKPKIVGLSALTSSLRTCVQLAKAIRQRFGSDIKICLGGSHISADPDFYNRFPLFDVAVTGEGERVFRDLALRLMKNEQVEGVFAGTPWDDLDAIPFPARHLVEMERYECAKQREIGLITSRGCPFKCNFCSRPAVSKNYRMRSAKNIVDEIEIFYRQGWERFYFLDDILTLNRDHILGLCEELSKRKLEIKWGSNTRADCVDEELIGKMAEAGCKVMLYGVESGNQRIRNEVIGKGVSDEEIIRAIRLTNKKKIVSGIFLMMGFPTEGEEELRDTIHFGRRAEPAVIGVHLTKPMPGAKIFYQGIKEGIIEENIIDRYAKGELGEGFAENWPVYVPPGITLARLNRAKKKAMFLFYFRPKWILQNAGRYLLNWNLLWFDFRKAVSIFLTGQSKESMS